MNDTENNNGVSDGGDAYIDEIRLKNSGPWRIALISSAILILELSFIRIIPAEVKSISYFTNLILMATFFGMGLGCILQKKRSLTWLMPVGLLCVFFFILAFRGIVIYEEATEVHYWLQDSAKIKGQAYTIPLFYAALLVFVFTALPFVALGQALARSMEPFSRLRAYAWDIFGSLVGTLIFVLSSMLYLPPWMWPPLIMAAWTLVFVRSNLKRVVFVVCGVVFVVFAYSPYDSKWSPYYYIQYNEKPNGVTVWVNSSFHQFAVDFTSKEPSHRASQLDLYYKWSQPYAWYREIHGGEGPGKVLVLGAGTGNDINIALANNAREIVAVEIDPVILSLGKRLNKTDPYGDERVRTVVDDGRHFLRTSDEKFDMIIFGTLDSQALLSSQANLRLENYVYTRESLEDTKRLLNDTGMVAIYYSVFKPWLINRIYSTVRAAFGEETRVHISQSSALFNTLLAGTKGVEGFKDSKEHIEKFSEGIPSTDDWPFIYLERPTIAPVYVKLVLMISALMAAAFVIHRRVHAVTGLHANFLFLGLGFTLMESSAIVRLALVFGSTWVINAVVFSSVLVMIFVANLMVMKRRGPSLVLSWVCLLVFVLVNYFLPIPWLFEVSTAMRVIICAFLIGTPVYFAAVCFSRLFEREKVTGYPLGINLIGAMGGGMIEYSSMAIGMRSVWLIVLFIYLLAWASTSLIGERGR